MRNLFLFANFIAHKQGDTAIRMQYVVDAVKQMYVGDSGSKIALTIYKYLINNKYANKGDLVDNDKRISFDIKKVLRKAKDLPMLPVDIEIEYAFLDDLGRKGFTPETNVIPPKTPPEGHEMLQMAKDMKESLSSKLYGQDLAIDVVTDSIKNNLLTNENGPKSTYLFIGPPATGKTYLAELMAKFFHAYKLKKFDMTQFTHPDSGGMLYGTSRNWGNAKPGALTSFVRKHPKSIIVLDEFEKANNQVQATLLSIFSSGHMKDACGWCKESGEPWNSDSDKTCDESEIEDDVDFTKSLFIITSNLGKELYSDHKFLELIESDTTQAESMILDALLRETKQDERGSDIPALLPELISRFSQANIVLFNKLDFQAYYKIADTAFKKYKKEFISNFLIDFKLSKNYSNFLTVQILSFAPLLDARRIKAKIAVNFFDKITDQLMQIDEDISSIKKIKIILSKETSKFIKEELSESLKDPNFLRNLFRKNITLKLIENIYVSGDELVYKIESCEFKKVDRVKDFTEDGLVFDIPDVKFTDIAGHEKIKTRLSEIVRYLKNPQLLENFDITPPRGMLLYGVPGTGKTLLAKAFAAEAELPFIATTGSDLIGEDKIKNIFSKAKEYAPSIVFIDEIDALGKRGTYASLDTAITKLLAGIDGFSNSVEENIFVIAATNHIDEIDSAILRPGRIELHFEVNALDKNARKYFINKIIKNNPIEGEIDVDEVVMFSAGMTGATLEQVGREAALYCLRHDLSAITQEILIEQINTIKYGEKISHENMSQLLESTAIHEAGHAVLSRILMPQIEIEQITVAPRGNALGFVSYNVEDTKFNVTVEDVKNKICISLAGRAAQIEKYGKVKGIDTGAMSDLESATALAYTAIGYYGMDEEVGSVNIMGLSISKDAPKNATSAYEQKIEKAVERWLKEAEERTQKLVKQHWEKIEKLTALLLEEEIVTAEEMEPLLT